MTPDEARALLDDTTPGDEWRYRARWNRVWGLDPIRVDRTFGLLEVSEEDAALIVAAPALARTIAGMTTEHRHEVQSVTDGTWHPLTEWAEGEPDRRPWNVAPTRIVRRYVTESEEV